MVYNMMPVQANPFDEALARVLRENNNPPNTPPLPRLTHANPLANQINPNINVPPQGPSFFQKFTGVAGLGFHIASRPIVWTYGLAKFGFNVTTGTASLGLRATGSAISLTPTDVMKYAVGISNIEKAWEIIREGKDVNFKNSLLMIKDCPDPLSKCDSALKEISFGILKMASTGVFYGGGTSRLLTTLGAIDPIEKPQDMFDIVRDFSENANELVLKAGWKLGEGAVFVFPYVKDAVVALYNVSEKIVMLDPGLFAIVGTTAGTSMPFFYYGAKNLGFQSKLKRVGDAGDYKLFETSGGAPGWKQWFKGWAQIAAGTTCFALGTEALLLHKGLSFLVPEAKDCKMPS